MAVLEERLAAASQVISPALLLNEVANILWKLQRVKALPDGAGPTAFLRAAAQLLDHLEPERTIHAEVSALTIRRSHPLYGLYLLPGVQPQRL